MKSIRGLRSHTIHTCDSYPLTPHNNRLIVANARIELVVNNQEHFQTNSTIHSVNTRNSDHLHRSIFNISCFQKSAYYADIEVFNSLLSNLRSLMNKRTQFKVALKRYLNTHSIYTVEELLALKMTHTMCKRLLSYCLLYAP